MLCISAPLTIGAGGRSKFVEAAAQMGPEEGKLGVPALFQRAIAGIAVNLQDAGEAGHIPISRSAFLTPNLSWCEQG